MTRAILLFALILAATGCHKNVVTPGPGPAPQAAPAVSAAAAAVEELRENFGRVHFEFDSSTLNAVSKEALDANAAILQRHPSIVVEVQGHADQRGTTDYNLALGDRRATSVTERLVLQGVAPKRIRFVSYGEERPADPGEGEVAWSQNRRAEFLILVGPPAVSGTTDI